jgi:hypothetical protein
MGLSERQADPHATIKVATPTSVQNAFTLMPKGHRNNWDYYQLVYIQTKAAFLSTATGQSGKWLSPTDLPS